MENQSTRSIFFLLCWIQAEGRAEQQGSQWKWQTQDKIKFICRLRTSENEQVWCGTIASFGRWNNPVRHQQSAGEFQFTNRDQKSRSFNTSDIKRTLLDALVRLAFVAEHVDHRLALHHHIDSFALVVGYLSTNTRMASRSFVRKEFSSDVVHCFDF